MNEFKNANTFAHAVNDSLGAPFVPRPFNRFSPDENLWWLVGWAPCWLTCEPSRNQIGRGLTFI